VGEKGWARPRLVVDGHSRVFVGLADGEQAEQRVALLDPDHLRRARGKGGGTILKDAAEEDRHHT
jgi:hypothetical protein